MRGPVTKTCEHCGQGFECGQYGCWCGKVSITKQQMDWLATRFQNCLCPVCLNKVSTGELGSFLHTPISTASDERSVS